MVNKIRTVDFLPEIFRTHTNRQFLRASLDVLTDQPQLNRVEGFIGEKYGYGVEPTDKYVVEPTKSRGDYQLDPAVVFLKKDTQTAQDYINYPGIINALKHEGSIVNNHDRLFNNQFYSWDPFVDYDKIVNYSQYYWIPNGPDAIPISSNIIYLSQSYTVAADDNGYQLTGAGGTNPSINVLRGGTYSFIVPDGSSNFWLQTAPGIDASPSERTIPGAVNNGTDDGAVEWTVPDKTTLVNDKIYYQSGSDPNSVGIINLVETNSDNVVFVDDILGRKTYTSPNGIKFTNGIKVKFGLDVWPEEYQNKQFYVEGVGSNIKLLPVNDYVAVELSGEIIYFPWDSTPWDIDPWEMQLYVPVTPEYITISRNSRDYNAWTRANRWFHQDAIDATVEALGYITVSSFNTVTRAQRPIIEFRGNLKLFDSGIISLGFINIADTTTKDAFSDIEGKTPAEVGLIDGLYLNTGTRIIFTADTNPNVRKNVYVVNLVPTGTPGVNVINLVPDTGIVVRNGGQVFVYSIDGVSQSGTAWWFNGSNDTWNLGQQKKFINQYPLFDIFNGAGESLGNTEIYPNSTFAGTKLFSYAPGNGADDPVLGFPIAYSNTEAIGDILFTVNLNEDVFTYSNSLQVTTSPINIGFVHWYTTEFSIENLSGWVAAAGESFQYQVFEFPVIQNLTYSLNNVVISLDDPGSGYQVGDKLKILGSDLGGTTPENDLFFTVSSIASTGIAEIDVESISGICPPVINTYFDLDIVSVSGTGSSAKASVTISGPGTTIFKCDILSKSNPDETQWNPVVVYYNDNILDKTEYNVYRDTNNRTTTVEVASLVGVKVTVLIISSDVSKTAYYQVSSNLENNPFNDNIVIVSVGDLKNQYRAIFSNAPGVTGQLFGTNNIHNLGNLNQYGTAIIQNSASLVLPGVFLRKPQLNLFNALQFNSDQYQIYKSLLIDLAISTDYSIYSTPAAILDDIIYKISTSKNTTSAFFWSDMIFSGNPYLTNTYDFGEDTSSAIFGLSPEIWSADMYSSANYRAVGIYLTRNINNREITTQLLRDVDYTVSTDPDLPSVYITYQILSGDKITVKQYNQTYGSYCPNTPSKLGLYPIWVPEIVSAPPAIYGYHILGHDGSYTKLYGSYNPVTGILTDFRDQVLFEFEKRVYNNFKVSGRIPLQEADVLPGQGRTTEYSRDETLDIYSTQFLNWVGANRLDYRTQTYRQNNVLTYNYNQSSYKVLDSQILQGYWEGIYRWLYDTVNPDKAPWEMLGLTNKPDWWDTRYGAAPYTSGNTYMWQEIADGFVWNDGQPYIDAQRIRPYLLELLPVDSYGNLLAPYSAVMGNYNALTFNNNWVVGDGAPVESGYLSSSSWPYDLMRLLALTKPAKFFNLFADRDRYKFNNTLLSIGQYLYDERYHLDPRVLEVYGDSTAKHSYINWVVDYNNQLGENGTALVTSTLRNLDVRLTYNMAGFTAKNYLKFLVEKATPNSKNTSLLIPDENYTVLLYDNPPEETIQYSSVIVQKVNNGYAVWGNSKNKNYFTTVAPQAGFFKKVTVGVLTVQISEEYFLDRTIKVPYGTVFYSVQGLCQFLQNYNLYLEQQGVVFDNIMDGVEYNWSRMMQSFMLWTIQEWEVGSSIALNPNARNFVVNKAGLVPQPLTIQSENFLLNQNLIPIKNGDVCVNRENELLEVKVLTPADTIAYANINLNSIEHGIVFDNYTSFNDTIYNLTTGLRQSRLMLKGYKTAEWSGYINTSGFILNENNVKEWQPNVKYPKNIIVIYKNKYYTARKLIEPTVEFNFEDWLETEYGQIKSGLLPNPSTNAYEALFYYDTTRANLENDADLLAFSLIGFRPREYFAAADLSDITQINVYKNIVKYKGTKILADSFRGAQFPQGDIDYVIEENWAIKSGDFGSVLNNNFVEAQLSQSSLTGNPTLIGFANPGSTVAGVQQSIQIDKFINWERPPLNQNFLPLLSGSYELEVGIPSAGYVNLGDSKLQRYYYSDLNDSTENLQKLNRGNYVWIANHKSSWNIFEATPLENQITAIENNLNGTITVVFQNIHNLVEGDLITINGFDPRIDGFYVVNSVGTIYTITVILTLDSNVNKITGLGTGLKLISRKFEQASNAASSVLPYSQWNNKKIWVDFDVDSQWAVYGSGTAYKEKDIYQNTGAYGTSVAYSEEIGLVVNDANGKLYRYYGTNNVQIITGSGIGEKSEVKIAGNYAYCSSPDQNFVYVYKLNELTNLLELDETISLSPYLLLTGAMAVSSDGQWLYVADSIRQKIALFSKNEISTSYVYVKLLTDPNVPLNVSWGHCIATSTDGVKLVVGAPYETVNSNIEAGAVYVYTRRVQRFYADGITNTFILGEPAPNNFADIYLNDVLQGLNSYVVGNVVTVNLEDPADPFNLLSPPPGSVVTVSTGVSNFVQKFVSGNPQVRGWFGHSVDTNRYGAEIIVGAPFEFGQVNNTQGVEGAVYRYTNPGQRYGVWSTTITTTLTGRIYINGYVVNYSGDIIAIKNAINSQTPTNIVASTSGNILTITVKENTPETIYNIIDIVGTNANLSALGIVPYTQTQIIKNFDLSNTSAFGYTVKMDQRNSLLISAVNKRKTSPTTFDYTTDCIENDTIFDNDATFFVDTLNQQGMVYLYDYLPAYNEGISNPGQYAFGQYISTDSIVAGTPSPRFGFSLAYVSGYVAVSTPFWSTTGGGVSTFTSNWTQIYDCEVLRPTCWYIDKKPLPVVDINAISNINLYNTTNNQTLEFLDYIDPLQGKMLGAVATNLDFVSSIDPAGYTQEGLYWTSEHVGNTWLDLNTIRMLNYHQPDFSYNAKNWGRAFPGSTADIFTWIESTFPPLDYIGSGFPVSFDKYTTAITVDKATNSLVTKYYYWVKNYGEIPQGKTLSPLILSTYILNPINSGISYLTPITTNVVALYNSGEYIQANTSALHLGYGLEHGIDDKHTSWSLVRVNNPEDFLSGVPSIPGDSTTGLYLKYLESFAGYDSEYKRVPDLRLPHLVRYGTSFRPRQSMFRDRLTALKNYVNYANNILIRLPITEIRNLSLLFSSGSTFDTRQYWTYVNWWEAGYSDSTKAIFEVDNINDLDVITKNKLFVSEGGVNFMLDEGLIVKVRANKFGKSEYYVYSSTTTEPWTRIGAENSTVQILDTIYDDYGWSIDPWGSRWDKTPYQEIVNIIRWLNEQCYVGDLAIERNKSLILMFNYIQSESQQENNYLPWLNKTSLVDVNHRIRSLYPYKKYQRDNQEFLEEYLNEIKPYHVIIKEFVYSYNGNDVWLGNATDFDLPSTFNPNTDKFETPQLVYTDTGVEGQYTPTSVVWNQSEYVEWFKNTGVTIDNSELMSWPVTTLATDITSTSIQIEVQNVYGLPVIGTISISDEDITYDGVDYLNRRLIGCTRGANGTTATAHTAGSIVNITIPPVIVLNSGRGYIEPPKISAYIDTTIWPEPSTQAELSPIMAADRLIGVNVLNGGNGYAVTPQIIVEGSSIFEQFPSASINISSNVITITGHQFENGDPVVYDSGQGGTAPAGLTDGSYYYVRVIDPSTIALYEDYSLATLPITSPYLHVSSSDGRIDLKTQGTGSTHTLTVTARVWCVTTDKPIREFNINVKFDRVSYTLEEGLNTAVGRIEDYYQPTLSMPGKVLPQLMDGVEYPNAVFLGQQFSDGWDTTDWSEVGWSGILNDPKVDTVLKSPTFTDTAVTIYDVNGGYFLDGYSPEELVGGYVHDTVIITITSNDLIPNWDHTITIDKFGAQAIYSNSGLLLPASYSNKWWYGTPGSNPLTDPTANTTLSVNTNSAAVFLRN